MEGPKNYVLECCVDSVESALAAARGGATRLELCASLVTGGLSPSLALFREIRRRCEIRIHVLLRPRFGDFLYTDAEFDVLCGEVAMFRDAGAEGVVIGCLTPEGELDAPRMEALIARARGMSVTLHRAFDMCRDPFAACAKARALGIDTILTSGQQNDCTAGKPLLRELLALRERPELLIGGGVSAAVIEDFLRDTPARAFHLSGKQTVPSAMRWRNPAVSMGAAGLDEYAVWRTDEARIRAAADVLDRRFAE